MKKSLSFILALVMLIGMLPVNAVTVEGASSAQAELTLDSIAWGNLTYYDIFIENNLAYVDGFNGNSWGSYSQYAGANTITDEVCFTEPYCLKAFGSPSQQIVSSTTSKAGDYFVASKVYCTRYVKGELGVCPQDSTVGVTAVTDGFVTAAGIVTLTSGHRIYIGSIHSADLDGYVDDPVVVNMNIFTTKPTGEELAELYENYVQVEKTRDRTEVIYTDAQKLGAFMAYLKEKAAVIGMGSSLFEDPVGNSCNWVTAKDVAKLLIYANEYEQLHGIWSQASKEITVTGENARKKTVISTVIKEELEQYYHILGGKTGTLGSTRNLAVILEIPDSDDKLVVVALCANGVNGAEGNRYQAVKDITDAAITKYYDPSVDNTGVDVCCASAIACLLPADGRDLDDLTVLYEKDADTLRNPASITKVLTAICALDIFDSLDAEITYKQFDITTCPWNSGDFCDGDSMTLEHTLFALLLPSNDVTAFTVARSAGELLLTNNHVHSYKNSVTAPTCTEQGYTTYTCACGESFVDDYVDALRHEYLVTVTYPAGNTKGYTDYTCSRCSDSYRTPWLDIAAYEGMTIACVGDSITAAHGVTKDETDYVKLLAEQLGMDYIRLGVSGTTLCTDGSRTCNISRLTEGYLKGADVVTIAMGINDFCAAAEGYYELGDIDSTDSSTIYGAVRMWCERIVELRKTDSLSHTQFYFVTPVICSWNNSVTSKRDWDQSKTNIHGYTLRDLCNAIMEVAALYDVAVIDLNLLSGMYYVDAQDNNTAEFGGDGVHPGAKGHEMMAAAIANALLQNNLRDDHAHTYGSWITTTWPSCCAGKQQRVCTVCSATESRTLEPTGNHIYSAVVTAPTCTEQGYTTYTCVCGESYVEDFVDATGHTYKNGTCTGCGKIHDNLANYKGKVISILGDSTSSFEGYTPVNDGFNLDHRDRYPQDNLITDVNETWWMQVINELDAKLGINDSWAGSTVYWGDNLELSNSDNGEKAAMASLTRIQNLGSNGTPDVILFYGAGNDIRRTAKLGSFDPATAPAEVDLKAVKWETFADAYVAAIMRLQHFYPNSQILVMLYEENTAIWTDEKLDAYNRVIQAICDHYGVATLDLRGLGFRPDMFPDGAHPNAEGMDIISDAVIQTLLNEMKITAGENKVYTVSHSLQDAEASLHYWRGVSAGTEFYEVLSGSNLRVTVCMGGVDITDSVYANGVISISAVTGDLEIIAEADCGLSEHLQQLPDEFCAGVNVWTALTPENIYYTVDGWGNLATNTSYSVTFPVAAGDKIWASSLGYLPENGNGTRVTWFDDHGVLKSVPRSEVYAEFTANGYITAPEGAIALNVPMPSADVKYEIYILNRDHSSSNGVCGFCGKNTLASPFQGKIISIMGDSISTFRGYIPVIDGFNLGHKAFYPNSTIQNVDETWWMQVISGLDAKLGINESWADSQVLNQQDGNTDKVGEDAAMASLTRIQNLGANGTPDVILFFGGTNDIGRAVPMGSFDPNKAPDTVDLSTTKWDSFADAYVAAIMRMQYYYPDAQILVMIPYETSGYYTNVELLSYGSIMMAICDHYDVEYICLQNSGITISDLTDGIHPNAEGMTIIANAVQDALMENCRLQAGETVVYTVTHNTTNVFGSLAHYKGINAGDSFVEVLRGEGIQVTVKMGGMDITDSVYSDGIIAIPAVTGDVVITATGGCMLNEHLQILPEKICSATNIWQLVTPEQIYYTANGWGYEPVLPDVHSITIPVAPGDKIWASSFGYLPENGNGTRVTWFSEEGVLKSVPRTEVYAEFVKNGYIAAPEGAIALNVPMPSADAKYELYILNRDHTYENGICTGCGAEDPNYYIPGDINGDGEVNNKDLTRLFRHLSGYDVEVVEAALDVNGDGEVNNKDLTRLFRYLSGYDVEIQ